MQGSQLSYILLKDKEQCEKATRVLGVLPIPRAVHTSICRVLKGELVAPVPDSDIVPRSDGQMPHNYRTLTKDSPATFYEDKNEDNLAPLKPKEFDVLAAVKSPTDRYSIFLKDGKLDWGSRLKIGDKVTVELPVAGAEVSLGTKAYAMVRYVGPVNTLPGITFGVEIKDKDYFGWGTTNGVFQDELYFRCKEDCGLFVSLERLSRYPPADTLPQPPPSGQHYERQPIQRCRERPVPTEDSSTDPELYKYKSGDRVVVFTKKNDIIHGTVRWVGMYSYTANKKEHSTKAVGVETDVKVKSGDIDSLPAKTHYFTAAKDRSAVFLSEDEVLSETDFAQRPPKPPPPLPDRPINSGLLREAIQEGDHRPLSHQSACGQSEETAELARAIGTSHTELLQENRRALEEVEQRKQEQTLKELKQAVPDQSLNPAKQEHILRQISEERSRELDRRGRGDGGKGNRDRREDGRGRERGDGGRGTDEGGRGSRNLPQKPEKTEPVYDTVGEKSQGVTLPLRSQQQQQHQPLSYPLPEQGQPPPQPLVQHQHHHQQEEKYGQWEYPSWHPEPNVPQPHLQREFQSTAEQQHYHNIPPTTASDDFTSTGPSSSNASTTTPSSQPPSQSQPGQHHLSQSQPGQHHVSQSQPGQHHVSQAQLGQYHVSQAQLGQYHVSQSQPGQHHVAYDGQSQQSAPSGLEVGSAVQIANNDSRTGVIRWIGEFLGMQGLIAGVELDEPMGGCTDGEWRGYRCFTCLYGRGFFCPLTGIRPDTRVQYGAKGAGNPMQVPDWEEEDQVVPADQFKKYIGNERGIQGHLNSCYLDATIFGLFGLSDVFDSLFLENVNLGLTSLQSPASESPAQQVQKDIGSMLWKGIVNPLRKNGAVRYESVMTLRNKLDELGKMEGVNTAEKDPEEFLNMLFKHTLHVDPFILIKRPFGTEPEFFIQLFVEPDKSLKVPTIEILLEKMFKEQQISFASVPSKLLVQVPRYGKEFQAYKRIIPGIRLDPIPLLDCPNSCYICGKPAWNTCKECKAEFHKEGGDPEPSFCDTCKTLVHIHKQRVNHTPECNMKEAADLELLSVLCIETSHYVCFSRDPEEGRWLFFDSMANRVFDQFNIPRGVDCTAELNEWVYKGDPERLMAARPRDLPELVRRFTQDVYMCVYIQPDFGMYG